MKPIYIEVVIPMLSSVEISSWRYNFMLSYTGFKDKYRTACINEYPDDWKWAVDYVTQWLQELSSLYRHRVQIQVIDALSPLGLWKQIRYRLFRFPAFIVDNKRTYIGWDPQELEALIDERIHQDL
jgi:hypothetical protein